MFVPGTTDVDFKLRAQLAYLRHAVRNTHNPQVKNKILAEIRALERRLKMAQEARERG